MAHGAALRWDRAAAAIAAVSLLVFLGHQLLSPSVVSAPSFSQPPVGRRPALSAALSAATMGGLLGGLGPLEESAWAADNPFPYDVSRAKIAKKLGPFTGQDKGCPDPFVQVSLGDSGDGMRFVPDQINLVQGCYVELALTNPSSMEHNFVAPDFAKSVYSVVVLAGSPPAELKGQINELELKAGASLGWFLVPVKAGDFELKCTVKGHTEAGMVGRITVAPRPA
ncbi:unnamed protein product [Polarella glacialis]|uniref:Blue (type 1) copper domain-containing protein n=1 Tax=Polarella glacialis TaxID=89957 RepID=A0A813DFU2_POLGL|nr:unnamed protein product [Polarella glacialis]CAE8635502.1 unnamed protein product [Polarella glacialis]CAE8663516.1 unnamed protein product [Polarella glacialis]